MYLVWKPLASPRYLLTTVVHYSTNYHHAVMYRQETLKGSYLRLTEKQRLFDG